jgi:hypothetical protein
MWRVRHACWISVALSENQARLVERRRWKERGDPSFPIRAVHI